MRKITVDMYVSELNPNVKFVPAKDGGFITLVDPDSINVTSHGLFSSAKQALSHVDGVSQTIMDSKIELAQFLRGE